MDKWYQIAEVARECKLSKSKIYQLIAAGEIEVIHIGRAVRITERALRNWQERIGAVAASR